MHSQLYEFSHSYAEQNKLLTLKYLTHILKLRKTFHQHNIKFKFKSYPEYQSTYNQFVSKKEVEAGNHLAYWSDMLANPKMYHYSRTKKQNYNYTSYLKLQENLSRSSRDGDVVMSLDPMEERYQTLQIILLQELFSVIIHA